MTYFIFLVLFPKEIHGFIQEGNPSEKVVIVEEELDGIDIDNTENLEESPRPEFINEECENLIVVNDCGKLSDILTRGGCRGLQLLPMQHPEMAHINFHS